MRRFILTYECGNQATDREGIQFSSGRVLLESHPFGGVAWFHNISHMENELNAFGTTSIKWLDEEAVTSE